MSHDAKPSSKSKDADLARASSRIARSGLALGPLLALGAYVLLPDVYTGNDGALVEFSVAGRATAAIAIWMATWWFTEAVAIYATALLPLALFPMFGVASIGDAAQPYANELIFLFMGGFMLALSMQRWGLHRRVALVALSLVGDRPTNMVGGFMAIAAVLSMWVSNTATAVMLLPVAMSVVELTDRNAAAEAGSNAPTQDDAPSNHFAVALLLGIAYGASIGGVATPIGSPPNLFLISFAKNELGVEISFVEWMSVALPLVAVFLPIAWLLLTRALHPVSRDELEGGSEFVQREIDNLGRPNFGEKATFSVFMVTCTLWVTRPFLSRLELFGSTPLAGLSDAGIAVGAALTLFCIPANRHESVLDWPTASRLPWGILILFGGGLSLASAIRVNGVGEWLGAQLGSMAGLPTFAVVVGVIAFMVFLTELTSNTASTAALVPILAALAPGLGIDALQLIVPAAIAASCAFMLPVATPPNAVVFGSERLEIRQMIRAGIWLNFIAIALITLATYALVVPLLVGRTP